MLPTVALVTGFSFTCKGQSTSAAQAARDSLVLSLGIDAATADSLTAAIFLLEQQKKNLKNDTTKTYQYKHERTLQLNLSREDILKKWLTGEKYLLWRELYKRRLDPVVLIFRQTEH